MPVVGKEQERQLTPEEIAAQKIEGYIERVEKAPEISGDVAGYVKPQGQVTLPKPITDDFGKVVMEQARAEEPVVTLPLTETKMKEGLHHKVFEAIRWAAETCVYLIKKYPGRAFYPQK